MLLKRCYLIPWTNYFVCNFELEIIQESFSVHTQTSMAFIAKELKDTTKMKMQMCELGATGPPWRQRVRERERIQTFVVSRACVWKNMYMKYVYEIVWVDHTRIDLVTSWFGENWLHENWPGGSGSNENWSHGSTPPPPPNAMELSW